MRKSLPIQFTFDYLLAGKTSDTTRVLSLTCVTPVDGAVWEISFGPGLHGLGLICHAPSGALHPTTKPKLLNLQRGSRQGHERSAWITYGGVPFKNAKTISFWPAESLFWKSSSTTSPTMQFLKRDTDEPAVTCKGVGEGRGLRLVRTCSRPHMLQAASKKGQNTLVSWALLTIPVCVTYFLESLQSQQLTLFFFALCVLAVIWRSGDRLGSGICSTGHQSMRDHM